MKATPVTITALSKTRLTGTVEKALGILETLGIFVESERVRSLLLDGGARPGPDGRLLLCEDLVLRCLESAPANFTLYDAEGETPRTVGGGEIHFDPGSAALNLYDADVRKIRKPTTDDCVRLHLLVDRLEHYNLQSTSMVPGDVPEGLADRYRLYLLLRVASKPAVTGTFTQGGFDTMKAMLSAVRGGEQQLRDKPLAIFDCCPSPPLKWAALGSEDLVDCARAGIPAELVSMPLAGATAPVTLYGSIVQHCAESVSGVVIHQLASPGAPIVYGGSPAIMDMRWGTTPMGAIETMIMDCANAQIGRLLGLPTHAYMGLSDSKLPDYQAGMESGLGCALAALCGIDVVSGVGMLDFESCQSLEKLILDHDAVGMAVRLSRGIAPERKVNLQQLFSDLVEGGNLLGHDHTARLYRQEQYMPGVAVDRRPGARWEAEGSKDALARARARVDEILDGAEIKDMDQAVAKELHDIVRHDFDQEGAPLPASDLLRI